MSTIRYLLDENVDPLFRRELLRREPTMVVWKVGDPSAPPITTGDPDILGWCEDNAFILVTNNRSSIPQPMRDHLAEGRHIPGIIALNSRISMGEALAELLLIWGASQVDEYRDGIVYLPLS
jgi:hypothetical protein